MLTTHLLTLLLAAAPDARASKPVPAPAQVMVQMPVDSALLPTGPLAAVGAAEEGEFYMDLSSFERSDLPDTIRITTVIVRHQAAEPLLVVTTWVNCAKRVYQISDGRLYSAEGEQLRRTSFVRDKPYPEGSAPARFAAAYCAVEGPGLGEAPRIANYRAALAAPTVSH